MIKILALKLKQLGRLEDAIKDYEKVISLNPKNASAYNNLGIIFLNKLAIIFNELGRINDSIDCYD